MELCYSSSFSLHRSSPRLDRRRSDALTLTSKKADREIGKYCSRNVTLLLCVLCLFKIRSSLRYEVNRDCRTDVNFLSFLKIKKNLFVCQHQRLFSSGKLSYYDIGGELYP